jgi:hypothetical protein
MASLLIVAAGSAIGGAAITGTVLGLSGATIGYLAGSLLASALIKGPNSQGPRLGDLRVQGTEYGAPIPWAAGGPRIAGQIAWASARREIATTTKVGKGGGSKVTNYTYEVDLLILLTENQIEGVSRIWSNGEMVYAGIAKEGTWNSLEVYTGDPAQLPDPTYEAAVGIGNAPAYRGRGYVVVQGLQLGGSGQIPNLTFELGVVQEDPGTLLLNAPLATDYVDLVSPAATVGLGGVQAFTGGALEWQISEGGGAQTSYTSASGKMHPSLFPGQFWIAEVYAAFTYAGASVLNEPSFFAITDLTSPMRFGVYFIGSNPFIWVRPPSGVTNYTGVDVPSGRARYRIIYNADDTTAVFQVDNSVGPVLSVSVSASKQTAIFSLATNGRGFANTIGFSTCTFDGAKVFAVDALGTVSQPSIDTVQSASASLFARAGYDAEDYDTTPLASITKPVRGMALGQVAATRGALETLQTAYFFDPSKSDKIYLRPRSTTPVASIPYDDLGAAENAASDAEPLELTVGSELEMPSQISLSYNNTAADYNVATEHSDRLLSSQVSTQVVQLGLGMLPAEAKGVADGLLVDQLASLTRTTLRLPLKYAYIEPGDVFTVTNADGRVYRFRSTSKTDTLTTIEHQCVLDDAGALVSAAITSNNYALTDTVRQIAPTIWAAMDIPLLRDADNQAGFYVAMAPNRATPEDQWDGGVFVRAWSADAFEQLIISGEACTMGTCTTTLGSFASSGRFDETSTLTVRVTGQLSNTTRPDMLNDLGINAAVVGSEIIRFRLATLLGTVDGENEYRISGLLRGQRGTEQHMATHGTSERFVLLDATLRRVLNQNSELGVASEVKAVTLNTVLSAVTAQPFTDTGVAMMPFSVANLRCLQSGTDLALSWQRRTRLSYRYGGTVGVSAPLGEATELYRIEVFDGATLANTYTATDGAFTYTAAQITADGFAPTDPIGFTVRQVSEIVGPGFPSTVQGIAP